MDASGQEARLSRGPTTGRNACVQLEATVYARRNSWQRMVGEGTTMPKFKLSKADRDKVTAAARRIEEPAAALLTAVAAYNEALGELRELVRGIEADWQAAWDKRSERWQDGKAGQSAAEAITAWDALASDLEDIEVELPDVEIP